jgi:hypothetical protein
MNTKSQQTTQECACPCLRDCTASISTVWHGLVIRTNLVAAKSEVPQILERLAEAFKRDPPRSRSREWHNAGLWRPVITGHAAKGSAWPWHTAWRLPWQCLWSARRSPGWLLTGMALRSGSRQPWSPPPSAAWLAVRYCLVCQLALARSAVVIPDWFVGATPDICCTSSHGSTSKTADRRNPG